MFAAAGVALGCCVWSTAAVFGLGLLMSGLVPLNHIMRIGGALYLRLSRIEEAARSPST